MKYLIIGILVLLVIGGAYFFTTNTAENDNDTITPTQQQKGEAMTVETAKQRATEYWENTTFSDYSANYELMCNEVKVVVSKETYVQKYELDLEENPLRKPDRIEIGDARLEGNTALVRVTLFTLFYPEGTSDTTELIYENDKWCKSLSQETLTWLQE